MADSRERLRMAIVGGGTVGLSLALYLHQMDACDVSVYEATNSFTSIGAGLEKSHNAMRVYAEMGLAGEIYAIARASYGKGSNTWFDVWYGDMHAGSTPVCSPRVPVENTEIHRAELQALLLARIPQSLVYLGKRMTSYEQLRNGVVQLRFADGTSAQADVLVGADRPTGSSR